MKIMVVHPFAAFAVADVADGLIAGLREGGHEVVEYHLGRRLWMVAEGLRRLAPPDREPEGDLLALHASEGLVYRAVVEGVRWVLVVCGSYLHPNILAALRACGVRVAVVFTESPYQSDETGEYRLLPVTDVAFTNERTCVPGFQADLDAAGNGGRAHYLPHAFNPAVHRPDGEPCPDADRCDVLVFGTGFGARQQLLEGINWDGIDLAIGGQWTGIEAYGAQHRLHKALRWGCLANRDVVRLYRGAKIVLNPHRWAADAASANPRAYEVAACGAFQIADDRAEVAEVFGESVPTYPAGVPWRLEALIRRYLADDAERGRLASEARARVAPHTFANRAARVVAAIDEHDAIRRRRAA